MNYNNIPLQIYEMCLLLGIRDDHNVLTTVLETLLVLLKDPPAQVLRKFNNTSGLLDVHDLEDATSAGMSMKTGKKADIYENMAKLRSGTLPRSAIQTLDLRTIRAHVYIIVFVFTASKNNLFLES